MNRTLLSLVGAVLLSGAASAAEKTPARVPDATELQRLTARFAPVELKADLKALPDESAPWPSSSRPRRCSTCSSCARSGPATRRCCSTCSHDDSPLGRARLHAFLLNKGPWSRLDEDAPFIPGVPREARRRQLLSGRRHQGRGGGVDEVAARGRAARRPPASSPPSAAARDGKLVAVPYSVEYQGELAPGRAAAARGGRAHRSSPRSRPSSRSARDAFLSNDYYASDVAWMELDAAIEPTIGPYEVYEDEWFNYKAAFEAFITLRDDAETAEAREASAPSCRTSRTTCPSTPKLRNPKLGALAPIRVVNAVFSLRRRQPRRADGRLQPAQRRARDARRRAPSA